MLSVLVRVMAHDEDGGANDAFKSARGLTAATLAGGDVTAPEWRIQGDSGGEDIADTVRGLVDVCGIYVAVVIGPMGGITVNPRACKSAITGSSSGTPAIGSAVSGRTTPA